MKKIRTSGVFWGIVLIAAAVLLILDSLAPAIGLPDLPFIRIGISAVLLAWAVKEVVKGNVKGIVFPLAFIFIVMQTNISLWCGLGGERIISAWIVLLAALLLYVGVSLIFRKSRKRARIISTAGTEKMHESSLTTSVRYIDAAILGTVSLENNLGSLTVYIENGEAYSGGGVIRIENNIGTVEIYVPETWKVIDDIENSLGSINNSTVSCTGAVLTVKGENNIGKVRICNRK